MSLPKFRGRRGSSDVGMIHLFQPTLGREELDAVSKVFESNWVGKGAITDQFEDDFAAHLGVDTVLVRSVNTCTEGLFQSMVLLGIGSGDEVIVPTISHVSAANAVASSGAKVIFCDVDKRTLNATASFIERKITAKTKAVIIVHYGGLPCEMSDICQLLQQKPIALIEDSACSVASRYAGKACGTFGDIGAWSFDSMKIAVTGDGGMMYFRTADLSQRFEELIGLGVSPPSGFASPKRERWWEFEISTYGRRATMNDVASAIGVTQLKKLPDMITRRQEIHSYYDRELADLTWLRLPPGVPDNMVSSYYLYWIQTAPEIRDRLAVCLRNNDIYTTFRYYPLHSVKYYGTTDRLESAEEAAQATLCIPNHQSLSNEDLGKIVEHIVAFGEGL